MKDDINKHQVLFRAARSTGKCSFDALLASIGLANRRRSVMMGAQPNNKSYSGVFYPE